MTKNGKILLEIKTLVEGLNEVKAMNNELIALQKTAQAVQKQAAQRIDFPAVAMGIDYFQKSIGSIEQAMKSLVDTYGVQETAEARLQTVMKQRMQATDSEIESIMRLASTQQEIGIISDEVQLSGAQQIATYLKQSSSIETLLPAMNDLLAQQKGLNATTSDAVSIGNLMGNAMQGQTSALTQAGLTFSEAQEHVMKFGTETERAAMLAQIIRDNVGDMNAELAKTDAGQQKQLENTLGGIKEKIGGLVSIAMPFVSIIAQATIAYGGVVKLSSGFATLFGTLKAVASGAQTANIAIKALTATTVIGAVLAMAGVIYQMCSSTDQATDSMNNLLNAEERAKRSAEEMEQLRQAEQASLQNSRAQLELNIAKLRDFQGSKEEEQRIVQEMNNTYGSSMGYFSSVSDWYQTLTANSEVYCKQMVIEARQRMLANQIASKELERRAITHNADGTKRHYSTKRELEEVESSLGPNAYHVTGVAQYKEKEGSSAIEKAQKAYDDLGNEIKNLQQQMADAGKEAAALNKQLIKGAKNTPKFGNGGNNAIPKYKEKAATLEDIQNNIKYYQALLQKSTLEEAGQINASIELWKAKEEAIRKAQPPETKREPTLKTEDIPAHKIPFLDVKPVKIPVELQINVPKIAAKGMFGSIADDVEKYQEGFNWTSDVFGGLSTINGGLEQMKKSLTETSSLWEKMNGVVGGAMSLYQGFVQVINMLALAEEASAAAKRTETAATQVNTTAEVSNAAAKFFAAHAWIPWVGFGIAAASVAMMLATMVGLPAFANGGIAYGPTLGLFGEYAGAANNPEVVAPLNRLRDLIEPASGSGGTVRFRIDGRTLVGVLEKESKISRRS